MRPQTPLYRNRRKMEKFGMSLCIGAPIHRSIVVCLALVMVCALFLLTTVRVQASTVTINDQAGVLDAGRVQADAAQLPVSVLIYTTQTFTGDQDALNQSTREQLPNQDSIAIGIDTAHANISIEAGTSVHLSNSQTSDALSGAQSNYENGGDYTGATIAAIDSLKGALGVGGMSPLGVAVLILLGLVIVVLFVISRRRRRRDGSDDTSRMWNPYYGGIYPTGIPPSGTYGGGGGGFGGGAGGSMGGGSGGGGAGGHL
jgi:hypothetical protein